MYLETSTPETPGALSQHLARPGRSKVIRPPAISLRGLVHDLIALADYRDLLYVLSLHRIRVRYKQSILGVSWAILQPLALMAIYTLIFSLIAKIPTNGVPYALFAFAALLPWIYFSAAISTATGGLVSHSDLIRKVYFPREILPLTYIIAAFFDFAIASIFLVGLMAYYQVTFTANVFYVPLIVFILTLLVTAAALLLSAVQVRFRDIGVAMPLLLQLWMFASPVVYPLSAVPSRLRAIYTLNPMVGIVENFRRVTLEGVGPDLPLLGTSALTAVILLPIAYVYFKRVEATLADVI
jgi:lipopolysaccharide transport system permease protein